MKIFRPNLASPVNLEILRYPVFASAKLDGVRATVHDGKLMSRSMKPLPNAWLQAWCGMLFESLQGSDGEIIVGEATDPDVYRRTDSHVMSVNKADFHFTFWAFDRYDLPTMAYRDRLLELQHLTSVLCVEVLPQRLVETMDDLLAFEAATLEQGFEGVMLRSPDALYKQGRSSAREQGILKLKRHEDMEAVVIGADELLHNGNEAFSNELGRTARSSHQDNMVGMDTLGAIRVRGLNGPYTNVEFAVGTGFKADERASLWADRETLPGRIAKVQFFPLGAKDKPRFPSFKGWRDPIDMG